MNFKKILIGLGVLIIAGVLLFIALSKKEEKALEILKQSISNELKAINEVLNTAGELDIIDMISGNQATASIKLDVDTNLDELSLLNDYSLGIIVGFDKVNKKNVINLDIEGKKDKLETLLFYTNNKTYLNFKDMYEKNIDLDGILDLSDMTLNISSANTSNVDNFEVIADRLAEMFTDNITDSKVTKESVKEKINEDTLSLTKLVYTIDKEEADKLVKAWNELVQDDSFKKSLKNVNNDFTADDYIIKDFEFSGSIKVSMFIDNKYNIVKTSIDDDSVINNEKSKENITIINYKNLMTITFDDEYSETKGTITYSSKDDKVINLNITYEAQEYNYETDKSETNIINIIGSIKSNVKNSKNSVTGKVDVDLSVKEKNNTTDISATIEYGVENKLTIEIPKVSISNTTSLAEAFYDTNLVEKLANNEIGKVLLELLTGF